jgi:hypothetical protein
MTKRLRIVIDVEGGSEEATITINGDKKYVGTGLALFMDSPQEGNLITFFWNSPGHAAKAVVRGLGKAIEAGDEVATQFYRAVLKGFAMATGQDTRKRIDPQELLEKWDEEDEARASNKWLDPNQENWGRQDSEDVLRDKQDAEKKKWN